MSDVTAPYAPPAQGAQGAKGQSFLRDLLRRLIRERPVGAVSAVVVVLLCLVAIFADVLAPFHFMDMTMIDRLQGPSSTYPLGTDHIGRDLFSRLLYGARVSLGVGFAATTLSVVVSLLIGGVAGFVGGKLDLAVQRLVDAWMSFPGLLLLLTIIIIYSITIGWAIIAEASLSFLGFGLPPDVPSWGTMLSREGRQYMEMAPRLAMWPGVALTLVVYCLNMVGDALRDLLDPRLRGGGGAVAGGGGVGARAAERATKALQKLERSR